MKLNGKVALITGGGTGLGREVALLLGAEGMRIAISYSKSKAEADETVVQLSLLGVEAMALKADLSDTKAPSRRSKGRARGSSAWTRGTRFISSGRARPPFLLQLHHGVLAPWLAERRGDQ